jgi:hypothetical protein
MVVPPDRLLPKEREDRCVDLLCPFLRHPMTTAWETPFLEIGDKLLHTFDLLIYASKL